jgi:hypothetical protein
MNVSGHLYGRAAVLLWKEHSLIEWVLGEPHDQSGHFGERKSFLSARN